MLATEQAILAYFDAFNRADREGLIALLHPDVVHDINEGPREVGREAFRAFKARMDDCYREHISDLVVMTNGERGAAEFTCSGEYIRTDGGLPVASGQKYAIWAAAFFTVQNGLITRIVSCYNLKAWIDAVGEGKSPTAAS